MDVAQREGLAATVGLIRDRRSTHRCLRISIYPTNNGNVGCSCIVRCTGKRGIILEGVNDAVADGPS